MPEILRRNFLLSGLALLAPRVSTAAAARIDILPDEPIGTISPNIYGHFTEHIGGVIYDGVWVGENSKIANVGGIRKELIENLKRLKPPVIRWPGGCFADSYNWRDGVGPRSARPKRTNFWANNPYLMKAPDGPQKYDPNEFGTNEFAHFCKAVGSAALLCGKLARAERIRLRSVDRILQLSRWHDIGSESARPGRRPRAVSGEVLGSGK